MRGRGGEGVSGSDRGSQRIGCIERYSTSSGGAKERLSSEGLGLRHGTNGWGDMIGVWGEEGDTQR